MNRTFVSLGSALAFLAVALGAFGTHSLRGRVSERDVEIWQTGTHYHLIHALALVLVGVLAAWLPAKLVRVVGWLHVGGIAVFSGSLYLLVLSGVRVWGAVTPIGGVLLLSGWAALAIGASRAGNATPQGA